MTANEWEQKFNAVAAGKFASNEAMFVKLVFLLGDGITEALKRLDEMERREDQRIDYERERMERGE